MNKKFRKVASVALVAMMCMGMAASVSADNYSPVKGKSDFTFNKYLILDEEANVPNVTFEFTVEPIDEDIAANPGSTFEVKAAPELDSDAVSVEFTYDDSNSKNTTVTGESIELDSGKAFVKKTVTIDLSGVEFTEPGVYRYKITENECDAKGISIDTRTFYLDIYVIDTAGALEIGGYILHTDENAPEDGDDYGTNGENPNGKNDGFENTYTTHDLTFEKKVEGNQASKDKYFKFLVDIEGLNPYDTINVTITDKNPTKTDATIYDAESMAAANNILTIGADENGSISQKEFYLRNGQSIIIEDLPEGATWTITEAEEDYKASVKVTEGTEVGDTENSNSATDDSIEGDTIVEFINERSGTVPTGILMTVAPFAGLMVVGIAGAAVILNKKKKND